VGIRALWRERLEGRARALDATASAKEGVREAVA
jgi:hypothetical protein